MDIYFDMDGVLAKFLFGTPFPDLLKDGYWEKLPPQENPLEAARILAKRHKVKILSSYLEGCNALKEKKNWLRSWIPEIPEENWVFIPYGESKGSFVQSHEDILIDDRGLHGREWEEAGGKFIKVSVDKQDAVKEMKRFRYVLCPELSPNVIANIVEKRIEDRL